MMQKRIAYIQRNLLDNELGIYSDASLHTASLSTAGLVIISNTSVTLKSYDLLSIHPSSSCRAEIGAMCIALKTNNANKITIYSDCEPAMKSFNNFINNTKRKEKLSGVDLMVQVREQFSKCTFVKVKGHNTEDISCLNHRADTLTHCHDTALECPLELITSIANIHDEPPEIEAFRLDKLIKSVTTPDIFTKLLQKLESLAENLWRIFDEPT